ncbi:MAG: diguanylate cyclase domain-containing protein [Candidatus Muiribacteriaceae bacterium]
MIEKKCEDCTYYKIESLTGLYRREYFKHKLEAEEAEGFFVICDIDLFKKINDEYGHPVGDMVLKEFADNIRYVMHDDEYACRLGGEEFAVLLKRTEGEIADFFNSLSNISCRSEYVGKLTFSMGISEYDDFGLSYSCADKALNYAKNTGRNRYCFYDEIDCCPRNKFQRVQFDGRNKSIWLVFAGFNDNFIKMYKYGRSGVLKDLEDVRRSIVRQIPECEYFVYKDKALCITFTDKHKKEVEQVFVKIKNEFRTLDIMINSYPGVTSLAYLFADTWNAFLCHDMYEKKDTISWFRKDTFGIIGVWYFRRRRFSKAYSYFRRAYLLNPSDENVLNLSACMIAAGKMKSAEILLVNREGLERYSSFFINLANIFYRTHRYREAAVLLEAGYRSFPDSDRIRNNLKEISCLLQD